MFKYHIKSFECNALNFKKRKCMIDARPKKIAKTH